MAQFFSIHPTHPQHRLIARSAQILRSGGLIAYPTDSSYALGCHLGDADALARLRRIRGIDEKHLLTLMCSDLSQIGSYAIVDNAHYRLLRAATPGSYTFILRATRDVPRRLLHARRRTIGVRVPAHPVTQALLAVHGEPILSGTLTLAGASTPLADAEAIRDALEGQLDLIIDGGTCGDMPTTVIDLSGDEATVVRIGGGSIERIGLTVAS